MRFELATSRNQENLREVTIITTLSNHFKVAKTSRHVGADTVPSILLSITLLNLNRIPLNYILLALWVHESMKKWGTAGELPWKALEGLFKPCNSLSRLDEASKMHWVPHSRLDSILELPWKLRSRLGRPWETLGKAFKA
jgi:hypothetical protein